MPAVLNAARHLVVLLACTAVAKAEYTETALADEITELPGLNYAIKYRHFSGYIEIAGIKPNATKHVHYHFIESETDPTKDPVVWWTNGGPGCSGLLGLYTEQGPYRPTADGVLIENKYRWNQVANMLFVEQPVGVGFSYSTDPTTDYELGDRQAAKDNYAVILAFFEKFPQYLPNDFVISSESWGGHYIPSLAVRIVREQAKPSASPKLNFVGFLVGNPFTSWVNNRQATVKALVGHSLVSYPTAAAWEEQCADLVVAPQYLLGNCIEIEAKMNMEMADLNPYALSYPVCLDGSPIASLAKRGRAQRTWLLHHTTRAEVKAQLKAGRGEGEGEGVRIIDIDGYEPCEDNYLVSYLNQPAVKEALHVDPSIVWDECSNIINYDLSDFFVPMEPLYKYLINGKYGLKMLVYSGDDDSVCGTWGTQKWMYGLGQKAVTNWLPWRDEEGQVAGFVTQFRGNLTMATVAGAGHEVPTYTPATALELFKLYLDGSWFDPMAFRSRTDEGEDKVEGEEKELEEEQQQQEQEKEEKEVTKASLRRRA